MIVKPKKIDFRAFKSISDALWDKSYTQLFGKKDFSELVSAMEYCNKIDREWLLDESVERMKKIAKIPVDPNHPLNIEINNTRKVALDFLKRKQYGNN